MGAGETQLSYPMAVAIDGAGDLIIADNSNNRIQKCSGTSPGAACTTVLGGDTQLSYPTAVAIDRAGNLFIVDSSNYRIQKCSGTSPGAACTTVAGTGEYGNGDTQLSYPTGVAIRTFE